MDTVGGAAETNGADRTRAPEMPSNIAPRARNQMTVLRTG
jgi:hypothetical protein